MSVSRTVRVAARLAFALMSACVASPATTERAEGARTGPTPAVRQEPAAPAVLPRSPELVSSGAVERCVRGPCTARSPLLVVLHGLGDRPDAFLGVFEPLPVHARVVALQAPLPWGDGFAWVPYRAARDTPEAIAGGYRSLVPRVVATLATLRANGEPTRVVLTGFSQGGMMTESVAALAPDAADAYLPVGGFLPVGIEPIGRGGPIVAFHGEADPVVPIAPERVGIEAFVRAGRDARLLAFQGVGHTLAPPLHAAWMRELGLALAPDATVPAQ